MLKRTGLLILLFCTLCLTFTYAQDTSVINFLEPASFHEQFKKQKAQLIDIRTPQEYKKWHYENALNINYYDKDFPDQLSKLNKETPTFIYCATGGRSAKTAQLLESLGFKKVYALKGFYTDLQAISK